MDLINFNPVSIDWENVPAIKTDGESGYSMVRSQNMGNISIRQIEYTPDYMADHWCVKGHIVHCLRGEIFLEQQNSMVQTVSKGMTYLIGDHTEAHRLFTRQSSLVLVID